MQLYININTKLPIVILLVAFFFTGCKERFSFDHNPYPLHLKEGWPSVYEHENNPLTIASVEMGRRLFYDIRLSRDGTLSCASCHIAKNGFSDPRPKSKGIDRQIGFRNSGTLTNVGFLPYFNRDGGVPKLDLFATVPIEDEAEMGHNLILLKEELLKDPYYTQAAKEIYDRSPDAFAVSRALGSFLRTFVSDNSKYDQFLEKGDSTLFTAQEKRGLELFYSNKAQCSACHSGILFSDMKFHNNGLYDDYKDKGRYRITNNAVDVGKFRTASLRNIELTGPYMHDGSLSTLEEVLDQYIHNRSQHINKDERINEIKLTEEDKINIIAFLKTLTDLSFINDTIYSPLPSF